MVSVAHQHLQLLQYIYKTLPSITIASNFTINADLAKAIDTIHPKVVKDTIGTVSAAMNGFPKVTDKIQSSVKALTTALETISSENILIVRDMIRNYDRLITLRLNALQRIVGIQIAAKTSMSNFKDPETAALFNAIDPSITQSQIADAMQSKLTMFKKCKEKVDALLKQNTSSVEVTQIKTFIDSVINSMSIATTGSMLSPTPSEGFVSGGNPYNAPSPNLTQAYAFRIGKRELVNEVSGTSLIG